MNEASPSRKVSPEPDLLPSSECTKYHHRSCVGYTANSFSARTANSKACFASRIPPKHLLSRKHSDRSRPGSFGASTFKLSLGTSQQGCVRVTSRNRSTTPGNDMVQKSLATSKGVLNNRSAAASGLDVSLLLWSSHRVPHGARPMSIHFSRNEAFWVESSRVHVTEFRFPVVVIPKFPSWHRHVFIHMKSRSSFQGDDSDPFTSPHVTSNCFDGCRIVKSLSDTCLLSGLLGHARLRKSLKA